MKVLLLLFAFTLLHPIIGSCQGNFLSLGGGLTSASLVDEGFSPLIFSGTQVNGVLVYENSRKNKERVRLLHFSSGNLDNRFGRDLNSFAFTFSDFIFYKGGENSKKLLWGWSNNNSFSMRFLPDFSNYNGRAVGFTSFGPAAKYNFPFGCRKQQFNLQLISHVQLVGFYIPSGYVSSVPSGFSDPKRGIIPSVFHSAFIFYPGNAFNLGIWPKVQWELKSGNRVSVDYLYDYTSFKQIHSSRKSQGSLFVTLSTRI